ncbi:hypothetical protein Tco_0252567 [Tanacetum coccineum]
MEGNRGLRYGLRAENEWKRKVVNGGTRDERKFVEVVSEERLNMDKKEDNGKNAEEDNDKQGDMRKRNVKRMMLEQLRLMTRRLIWHCSTSVAKTGAQVKAVEQALYSFREINVVDVIEEVRDIVELEIEVAFNNSKEGNGSKESQKKDDGIDMIISDSESNEDDCEEETDSEDDESDEDDDDDVGGGGRPEDDGDQKRDEDEESRCSDMSRVCETPEEEVIKEQKVAAPRENLHGNGGTKDLNKLEKQDKDDSYFCYNINENVYENNMTGQRKISGP